MDAIITSIVGSSTVVTDVDMCYLKVVIFCIILDTLLAMFNNLKGGC